MRIIIAIVILMMSISTVYAESDSAIRSNNKFIVSGAVAPINFPFPLAYGANIYVLSGGNWMFGLDFQRSSISVKIPIIDVEVGSISEKYYTLQARRFVGNSFNFLMGAGKRNLEVKFAKDFFELATGGFTETASELETRYIRLGVGNQWLWKNKYNIAVDWLTLNIPYSGKIVQSASRYADPEDKEDVEDAEDILKFYPSLTTLHFNFGVTF